MGTVSGIWCTIGASVELSPSVFSIRTVLLSCPSGGSVTVTTFEAQGTPDEVPSPADTARGWCTLRTSAPGIEPRTCLSTTTHKIGEHSLK